MKFNFNKRGLHPVAKAVITLVVLVALGIFLYTSDFSLTDSFVTIGEVLSNKQEFGNTIGNSDLNFLTYIVGGVPGVLSAAAGDISAAIIIVATFFILLLTFGDILDLFGSFSRKDIKDSSGIKIGEYSPVAWIIGILLTIVAANMNLIMIIASLGMIFIGGVGALAVVTGLLLPFFGFLVIHTLMLRDLKDYLRGKKTHAQFKTGMGELKDGITAFKEAGRAIRN